MGDMTHPDILRMEQFGELETEDDFDYEDYRSFLKDEYRDREVTFDE